MTGPLSAVLAAIEDGRARSLTEIEAATGLSAGVVSACVDHLVRMGRLTTEILSFGCHGGDCGSCAIRSAEGADGCHEATSASGRRGPGLRTLTLTRR